MQPDPESCVLRVHCPERRIWHAHAGTYLAETEGTFLCMAWTLPCMQILMRHAYHSNLHAAAKFEGQFGLTNPLGYAERIDITMERSTKNSTEYALQFMRPRIFGSSLDSRASLAQHFLDRQQWSSYVENYRGSTVGLTS